MRLFWIIVEAEFRLPKTSLFHHFKRALKALNFPNIDPWLKSFHVFSRKGLNSLCSHQQSKDRKGFGLQSTFLSATKKRGLWSDILRCKANKDINGQESLAIEFNKALSILELENEFLHVSFLPWRGRSNKEELLIKSLK